MTVVLDPVPALGACDNVDPGPLLIGFSTESDNPLFERLSKDIPRAQQLREFFHNSLQATMKLGGGEVIIDYVLRDGVRKLAFIDTGIGMDRAQLLALRLLGKSGCEAVDGSRFGIGAKVAGLYRNPRGLEYLSWTGDGPAQRMVLAELAPGEYGVRPGPNGAPVVDVPVSELPDVIRDAGHGTQVVLLGETHDQDTFVPSCYGLPDKNKPLVLWINTRYAQLPDTVNVAVRATRSAKQNTSELRRGDVAGVATVLAQASSASGVVEVPGATIRWYYSDPAAVRKGKWRHGDNAVVTGLVAVCLPDAEVDGLVEVYEQYTGAHALSRLAQAGVAAVSDKLSLLVFPHHAEPNAQRTGVRLDGAELPLTEWLQHFKANRGAELEALVAEAVSSNPNHGERMTQRFARRLKKLPERMRRAVLAAERATMFVPGGCGAETESGSHTSSGTGPSRAPTVAGGPGTGPGGQAASGARTDRDGEASTGPSLPEIVECSREQMIDDHDLTGRAGGYDAKSHTLFVNVDFVGIDVETACHLDGRTAVLPDERDQVRRIVLNSTIDRMVDAILGMLALGDVDRKWRDVDMETALSPDALTAVALGMTASWTEVATAVSRSIGRA